jgi:hypothetical protein
LLQAHGDTLEPCPFVGRTSADAMIGGSTMSFENKSLGWSQTTIGSFALAHVFAFIAFVSACASHGAEETANDAAHQQQVQNWNLGAFVTPHENNANKETYFDLIDCLDPQGAKSTRLASLKVTSQALQDWEWLPDRTGIQYSLYDKETHVYERYEYAFAIGSPTLIKRVEFPEWPSQGTDVNLLSVSPDRDKLIFVAFVTVGAPQGATWYFVDLTSSGLTPSKQHLPVKGTVDWAPDSSRFSVSDKNDFERNGKVHLVDANNSSPTYLKVVDTLTVSDYVEGWVNQPEFHFLASAGWSPDLRHLAIVIGEYHSNPHPYVSVAKVGADGKFVRSPAPQVLTGTPEQEWNGDLAWSPDATKLTFNLKNRSWSTSSYQYLWEASTKTVRRFETGRERDPWARGVNNASWSTDSRYLAYGHESTSDIFVADPSTTTSAGFVGVTKVSDPSWFGPNGWLGTFGWLPGSPELYFTAWGANEAPSLVGIATQGQTAPWTARNVASMQDGVPDDLSWRSARSALAFVRWGSGDNNDNRQLYAVKTAAPAGDAIACTSAADSVQSYRWAAAEENLRYLPIVVR